MEGENMTEVKDLIDEKLICLDLEAKNKEEVIKKMACLIHEDHKLCCLPDCDENNEECNAVKGYINSLFEREASFSTAVGYSFAIPHGKSCCVDKACIAYSRLKEEIPWDEEEKVKHIFMIGVSDKNAGNEHLEILIKLSTSILEDDFREKLDNAKEKREVIELLEKYSEKER
ncbi:PTS sugar transporter subunit IIA [Streptobacillus felis]|uniref:PTS sugar transporter subunit IIA n=1 Tax=Streptobacillus felis TaxID=1384509 RepID=UPI000A4CD689|nr:PTS sugar transporter subunit IIA [Streptobacillus felis]